MRDVVLLVIDTQKGITDERLFEFDRLRQNIMELIALARKSGVEVVFVQHDDGPGSGFSKGDRDFEIYDDFAPAEGEKVFVKTVNSALHPSTGLADYLRGKGIKTIIAVGLQTNYCVDATIHTGFDCGFRCLCRSTRTRPLTTTTWTRSPATAITTSSCGTAGSATAFQWMRHGRQSAAGWGSSMASTKEYLDYILDQLSLVDGITHRAMMGEYILYVNGKIFGGIYDDRLLVKPTKSALAKMPEAPRELPYEGAKEMLLVEDVDNREFLRGLVTAMYGELPAPKKR